MSFRESGVFSVISLERHLRVGSVLFDLHSLPHSTNYFCFLKKILLALKLHAEVLEAISTV